VRLGWSDHFLIFYKEKTPVVLCTRTSWEGVLRRPVLVCG
jgi:hypothetical protein